jgi:hypothetical protein
MQCETVHTPHRQVTWIGRHPVEDSTQSVEVDEAGKRWIPATDIIAYELRAAHVVLSRMHAIDGEVLKDVRKIVGLSLEQLAELVPHPAFQLARMEEGTEPVPRFVQGFLVYLVELVQRDGDAALDWLRESKPSNETEPFSIRPVPRLAHAAV